MIKSVFIILLFLAHSNPVHAEIYKWVDGFGKIHFGDSPDNSESAEKIEIEINRYEQNSPVAHRDNKHVIMYATSWCGYCKKARNYFKANSIQYTEYDIEKNKRAKKQYDAIGGKGIPVILIGNKRMNGFSSSGFERIYKALPQ